MASLPPGACVQRVRWIRWLTASGAAVLLLLTASVHAETCADICAGKGLGVSWCTGTAPFCAGDCRSDDTLTGYFAHAYSSDVITCPGSCTDGSSCWTGHKECSCAEKLACHDACETYVSDKGPLKNAVCTSDNYQYDCSVEGISCGRIALGWCDTSNICYCTWQKS